MTRVEIDLLGGLFVEAVDVAHRVGDPARGQQIGLFDEVEKLVFLPRGILEAAILGRRLRDRIGLFAKPAPRRRLPKRHIVAPEIDLRTHELGRVRHHLGGHFEKGVADIERIGHPDVTASRLAGEEIGHQRLAALRDLGHRARELDRVGQLDVGTLALRVAFRRHREFPLRTGRRGPGTHSVSKVRPASNLALYISFDYTILATGIQSVEVPGRRRPLAGPSDPN